MAYTRKLFLLLTLLVAALTQDCKNLPFAPKNCDYYTQCLEPKFKCGPTGYPIGYGNKYCNKFLEFFNDFTPEGQEWIGKTLLCLKNALIPVYESTKSITCSEIYNIAFDSHPTCYTDSGFCNLFADPRIGFTTIKGLLKVLEVKDMASIPSFKQVIITAGKCGKSVLDAVWKFIKDIIFSFKHNDKKIEEIMDYFGNDW